MNSSLRYRGRNALNCAIVYMYVYYINITTLARSFKLQMHRVFSNE